MQHIVKISDTTHSYVAKLLAHDAIAVLPTDTLYALCANASSDVAVEAVFQIKQRDANKALPIFVASLSAAQKIAIFNDTALRLATEFWPGALTLVLPIKNDASVSHLLRGKDNTIAIRIPDAPFLLAVLEELNQPITATSANLSGVANNLDIGEIADDLGHAVKVYIQDESLQNPDLEPSTIISCLEDKLEILRPGKIKLSSAYK